MTVSIDPLAPAEAIKYWTGKTAVSSKEFQSMNSQARTRAFAVSGLAQLDQVGTVQDAISSALANGENLSRFKGRISEILETQGWIGKRAWRVENIFRTNVQSAYMAGRFSQMKRVAKRRPYWQLVAVKDRRTRQTHLAVDGLVYPHDHPFWQTWYPPNGFACRCVVITLSERQVQARGLQVQSEIPDTIRLVDPETGMETIINPVPDRGWATNIGEDWLAGLAPSELDGSVVELNATPVCRSGDHASGSACRPPLDSLDARHIHQIGKNDILPRGLSDEAYVRSFLGRFGITDINGSAVHRLPGNIPVVISKHFFVVNKKTRAGWKVKKNGREVYLPLLARTILDPFEIWKTSVVVGGRQRPCLNLLRLFSDAQGVVGGYGVFHLIGRRWSAATVFTPQTGKKPAALFRYLEKKETAPWCTGSRNQPKWTGTLEQTRTPFQSPWPVGVIRILTCIFTLSHTAEESQMSKWINIFKTGTHTDSANRTRTWTGDELDTMVANYNQRTEDAPLVFGHPKSNAPAQGWIKKVRNNDGILQAQFAQITDKAKEEVDNGGYKYGSLSVSPDLKIRHFGLLGAVPPAIKGLGRVEFTDHGGLTVDINFSEPDEPAPEDDMTKERIKELEAQLADAKKQADDETANREKAEADLKAREAEFAQAAAEQRKADLSARVDKLVDDGKLLPVHKDKALAFCEAMDSGEEMSFSEDEGKKSLVDHFLGFLADGPDNGLLTEFSAPEGKRDSPEIPNLASDF